MKYFKKIIKNCFRNIKVYNLKSSKVVNGKLWKTKYFQHNL